LRRNIGKFDWSKYGGESAKKRIRTKAKEQAVDLESVSSFIENNNCGQHIHLEKTSFGLGILI
jgi:hypothetical protein